MNPKISSLLALVICIALSSAASSGELVAKTFSKRTYAGSRERQYQVYVPDTVTGSEPVPMVMVLHGCRQTERNMIDETVFKQLADRDNSIVVYPFITGWEPTEARNPNCWRGSQARDARRTRRFVMLGIRTAWRCVPLRWKKFDLGLA